MTRTASYYGPNQKLRDAELTVYPAVREGGRLFVTIDLVPQGPNESVGSDYFCFTGTLCRDMGGISLIDGDEAVRYGPLRESSAKGAVLSSRPPITYQGGRTYRFGVFFPDLPSRPDTVDLELLYAGAVLDLPVVDGGVPTEQLGDPAQQREDGEVVVLPVAEAGPDAFVDSHPLTLSVVGGTVGQGSAGDQSVVSLAADVLFAFGSAELTPRAQAVVAQAAEVLTGADPTKPVAVVGHTDSKGSSSANQQLSVRRAEAVLAALRTDPRLAALKLRPAGRGPDEPVAANELADGTDNPDGRALNRRVELAYTPVAAPTPPPAAPEPSPRATGSGGVPINGVEVVASGAGTLRMAAVVEPVVRVGRLSLVQVKLTPQTGPGGFDYFSLRRGDKDVGQWNVVVPSTGAVHAAARDGDGTPFTGRINLMNGGRSYRLDLWTAGLPEGATSVDVDLGQLGVAKGVPVA